MELAYPLRLQLQVVRSVNLMLRLTLLITAIRMEFKERKIK
nr:MAG TPA: hypothetical protein [Caudoviricetes sp.]